MFVCFLCLCLFACLFVCLFVFAKDVVCAEGEQPCFDRMQCLNESLFCDGTPHCADRSDEILCSKLLE